MVCMYVCVCVESLLPAPEKVLPGRTLACGMTGGPRCVPMCICLASEDTISVGGTSSLQTERDTVVVNRSKERIAAPKTICNC